MITFVLFAALLAIVVVGGVAVPMLRRSKGGSPPATVAALMAAGFVVIGAAILYAALSNYSWTGAPAPIAASGDTPRQMVTRLARRLESNPDDLKGWLMLGRSYMVLGEAKPAIHAYEQAERLGKGEDADALVGLGEALTLDDENSLTGRAGELFERALRLAPNSEKALFYGGAAAARRGEWPLARARFQSLLALNPPDNVKAILQQQIAAIDKQPGGAGITGDASVRVKVTFARKLGQPPAAPLFVIVRDPANPGPPLAVKKLASQFPQTVELTAADSMVEGRTFGPNQEVEVVARVAVSGNPVGAHGDPVGRRSYRVGKDGVIDLAIDRLTP